MYVLRRSMFRRILPHIEGVPHIEGACASGGQAPPGVSVSVSVMWLVLLLMKLKQP